MTSVDLHSKSTAVCLSNSMGTTAGHCGLQISKPSSLVIFSLVAFLLRSLWLQRTWSSYLRHFRFILDVERKLFPSRFFYKAVASFQNWFVVAIMASAVPNKVILNNSVVFLCIFQPLFLFWFFSLLKWWKICEKKNGGSKFNEKKDLTKYRFCASIPVAVLKFCVFH